MYKLKETTQFVRKYKKLVSKNEDFKNRILKTLEILSNNPWYKGLKTHRIYSKKYEKVYSTFVTSDIRLVWAFYNNELIILLLDIGGHSGKHSVYK